jgi:FkbM family methyltransferase
MLAKPGFFRRAFRSFALRAFSFLENNNNIDFATNGEKLFLSNLIAFFEEQVRGKVVFFDVGANVGEYVEMLVEVTGQRQMVAGIHAFEPVQSCFDLLNEKFAGCDQVILNKLGVSDHAGAAEIFYDQQMSGLASLYRRNLDAYAIDLNRSETIETIRLETYLEQKGIGHINLLKIDIEGHEAAAFRGLGNYFSGDFIDFIQFEYGGANLDSHTSLMEMYATFERAGFRVAKVMPRGLDIRPYRPWMENFQYANYVAVAAGIADKLK